MTDESDAPGFPVWVTGRIGRGRGLRGIHRALLVPIGVISTIAVTLGIAHPAEAADPQPAKRQPKAKSTDGAPTRSTARLASVSAPAEYLVAEGDTISGIAERFGLATAEVLAMNGLGWSSLIFPGQRLALPVTGTHEAAPPPAAELVRHIIVEGDTLGAIAAAHGVDLDQLLSANGLGPHSLIFPGQAIVLTPGATAVEASDPPPPAAPAVPAAPPSATLTVAEGDTLWDLAARHGVTVQALIEANGLDASGVIVVGRTLAIPGPPPVVVVSVNAPLTDEMRQNARIIVDVGRALGVPDQGIVVALAAAAQESGLKNLPSGDDDSLGVFQQRPSQGWGTVEQVLDPVRAATAFFGGPANPNPGVTLGLLDIAGWESMTVTQAAQAVQLSAHPDHYAKWESQARAWLSELG